LGGYSALTKKQPKGTQLKFVLIDDIRIVPRYLFEQVEGMNYDIDRLYEWANIMLKPPFNFIGVFIDKEKAVKGVLVASFNPISNSLYAHILSVDKEYQRKGIVSEATGILRKFKTKIGADKIMFSTVVPEKFETKGYVRSNFIPMESI
jgi:RimJ/RimL family protein N-acetyltransferase